MSNDLHDSHAVGDDEPDHYAAFIAQKPELGWVYTDGNGNTCLVVADEDDPHLAFYDGGIRPAEVVAQRGPLTRARIVPADAIVLERPDAEAIAELENVLGGGPGRLDLRDEIGAVQGPSPASAHVRISPHLLDTPAELNPTDARTLAAHIATAADEAERDAPGTVAFITPSSYVKGDTHAGMREHLRKVAREGWLIDLTPEGLRPELKTRIFRDVKTPLCLGVFTTHLRAGMEAAA